MIINNNLLDSAEGTQIFFTHRKLGMTVFFFNTRYKNYLAKI